MPATWHVGTRSQAAAKNPDAFALNAEAFRTSILLTLDSHDDSEASGLVWSEVPREALFLAGKAFMSYRKGGGTRTSPLPDFFIGAHAAVSDLILITRDPERVRTHFPRLRVVSPQAK